MQRVGLFSIAVATLLSGCLFSEPCDQYVDYICQCHDDDPAFDCAELQNTLAGSEDLAVQNECSILLDEQRDEDDAAGESCEVLPTP